MAFAKFLREKCDDVSRVNAEGNLGAEEMETLRNPHDVLPITESMGQLFAGYSKTVGQEQHFVTRLEVNSLGPAEPNGKEFAQLVTWSAGP